jgi:signal transduction histidine kinase
MKKKQAQGEQTVGMIQASPFRDPELEPNRMIEGYGLARRVGTLIEIGLQIDAARTREEILKVLRTDAKWLVDFDVCFVGLLNQTKSHYVINTLSSVADAMELNHKHFGVDEGMPGWVVKNGPTIIDDIESAPMFSHNIEGKAVEFGIKSLLIVPLRTSGDVLGAVAFGSARNDGYNEEDMVIAQLLAMHSAVAFKNARVFEEANRRLNQIELMNEISGTLTSSLDQEQVLANVSALIQRDFRYFDVTILLLNEEKTELTLVAHSGNFVDFLPHGYKHGIDEGIIGWVVRHGEKILANDVSLDPRYLAYAYHNTKSELALPIKMKGEVIGVLNIEDTKLYAFDETDAIVLETLTDQIGSAMNNARLYEQIKQSNMKLMELDKMKSEFVGIVSHDFRSPLSSIILAGKSLLKHTSVQGEQRVKEYLQIMVDQATRLNQLAEDTLSITKVESGQLSFHFKVINIERLIQDAKSMVRLSSRHTIEQNIDPNLIFIKGDQAKLRQVITNLISNAVKYSPKGGTVTVAVEDYSSDELLVSVTDEGIGIPPEQVSKLFQKFSRVDTGEAREIKGTGLGLWICREIVNAHGGKIWVESEFGKGSTFKFTLKKVAES